MSRHIGYGRISFSEWCPSKRSMPSKHFNYLVNEQHKQSQKLIKYGFAANYPKGVYKWKQIF